MGVEYELKYKATPAQLALLRQSVPGPERSISMLTTYYDTSDGALSARNYTLRRRLENGVSVCTLKAPIPGRGRGEWETACQRVEDAIEILCKLGAPQELAVLVQPGVIPICGAEFTRIAKDVILPGFAAELALDQGRLFSAGKQLPLSEAELELKSGSAEAMDAFAAKLAAAMGLAPEQRSKFRRALALYRGE